MSKPYTHAPNFMPASAATGTSSDGSSHHQHHHQHHPQQQQQHVPGLSNSAAVAVATRGTPSTLNVADIFGDCFFTPEGDAIFLSDHARKNDSSNASDASDDDGPRTIMTTSTDADPTRTQASKIAPDGSRVPVPRAGGIATTNLDKPGQRALVMGGSAPQAAVPQQPQPEAPMTQAPQKSFHLNYAVTAAGGGMMEGLTAALKDANSRAEEVKKRRGRGEGRKMSEQQKSERRERNREHAKRSRIRKKFLLESLQQSVALLKEENEKLRTSIKTHLGDDKASELLSTKNLEEQAGLIATNSGDANKLLDDPDFSFIKALQTAQQNFVVTDPSLPDNPIVYATQGFLNLTGYSLDQVLGRNCRFLQGPETDPKAVEKIRKSIEDGTDMSVCLLNYRVDGSTFWNQFFIAALRDAAGNITNYVGVQCKVSDQYAATVCKKQEEMDRKGAEGEGEDEDKDNSD